MKHKKIIKYCILAILGIIFGINIYSLNASRLTGNQIPMPFGVGASVVLSGSMEPTLSVDDLIFIKEAESYQVGDVVVYQSGNTPVVHTIIAMEDGMVTTQGDANNVADEPFPVENIKGIVVGSVPRIGALVRIIKTPIGTAVILGLAVLLVEMSFRKERKAKDYEKEAIMNEINQLMEEIRNSK
ncbi:MAG: signal peptidase I [Agathobacter sp.]|nr:signal peptidase I [Agathobacter sp.]